MQLWTHLAITGIVEHFIRVVHLCNASGLCYANSLSKRACVPYETAR